MQTGQVSVWVPITVALLAGLFGVVGVIVGQVINARRERQREDIRWQRERERAEQERVHDLRKHWLDRRTDLYGDVLAECTAWEKHISSLHDHHWGTVTPTADDLRELESRQQRLNELTAKIGLLGSDEMWVTAMKLTTATYMVNAHFLEADLPMCEWKNWRKEARGYSREIGRIFRRDLGLVDIDGDEQRQSERTQAQAARRHRNSENSSDEQISPSPPSSTTS